VFFTALWPYWAIFASFDIYDYCHVKLEHHLLRQSRDRCQSNGQEAKNHVLS